MDEPSTSALLESPEIPEEYKQRLLDIKKHHFESRGYQVVESDVLIFLISELHRFYFPSE